MNQNTKKQKIMYLISWIVMVVLISASITTKEISYGLSAIAVAISTHTELIELHRRLDQEIEEI